MVSSKDPPWFRALEEARAASPQEEQTVTYHLYVAALPPWLSSPLAAWAFRAQPRRRCLSRQNKSKWYSKDQGWLRQGSTRALKSAVIQVSCVYFFLLFACFFRLCLFESNPMSFNNIEIWRYKAGYSTEHWAKELVCKMEARGIHSLEDQNWTFHPGCGVR